MKKKDFVPKPRKIASLALAVAVSITTLLATPKMEVRAASTLVDTYAASSTTTMELYDTDGDSVGDHIIVKGTGDCDDTAMKNIPTSYKRARTVEVAEGVTTLSRNSQYANWGVFIYFGFSSVKLPSTLKSIGRGSFYSCTNLTTINIPDSVGAIGDYAFYGCDSLNSLTIPEACDVYGQSVGFKSRGKNSDFLIISEPDSPAHKYAIEKGLKFQPICDHSWSTSGSDASGNRIGLKTQTCTKCGRSRKKAVSVSSNPAVTKSVAVRRVNIDSAAYTDHNAAAGYAPTSPKMASFWDARGAYNVASYAGSTLKIQRYDANLNPISNIQIPNSHSLFGNVTIDNDCNYYVLWGQEDTNESDIYVLFVSKYDYNGKFLGECKMKASETPSSGGSETKLPFRSADVRMAINNGVLTCHFSKQRYDGHQTNYVIWVRTSDMSRINVSGVPYTSHSFYDGVIPTSDGGFLYANQGDAYYRGYNITKMSPQLTQEYSKYTFHFREGSNRDYGYNETYAQLGGLAETANAYILCASSEKTLSLSPAPTNSYFCGHSESRNLFIQIMKKSAGAASEGSYYVGGDTRSCVGAHDYNAEASYRLDGDEVDYGVIWLTALPNDKYVANPKIVPIDNKKFAILWEELKYETVSGTTYMQILTEDGEVVKEKIAINGAELCNDTQPEYRNGKIYWAVANNDSMKAIFVADINAEEAAVEPDSNVDPSTLHCKWYVQGGKSYWYENGVRQGTYNDPNGVVGDGTIRGREICDMESAGWYWLDSVYDGAKAINKEVWMPYIYQQEARWDDAEIRQNANASDPGMIEQVYRDIKARTGKWVRYDENGAMYKGWYTVEGQQATIYPDQAGNTYYYDNKTGLMAKGDTMIDGIWYHFDETTGVLAR